MKVILQQEVKKLGKKGDMLEVAEGYGRNYLLPNKLAVEATTGKLTQLQHEKDHEVRLKEKELWQAKQLGEKLAKTAVVVKTKAGDNGKLFGAVTSKELAELLKKDFGLTIDKRKIELKEPVKAVGEYVVTVKIHPEVHVQVKFKVTAN